MKIYLLITAAVAIQPVVLLAQTDPFIAGFQQAQMLGARGYVITLDPIPAAGGRGGRGVAPMIGKPYSATAVTHMVQTLGDGTQIETTESEGLYRDDQGRTRTETNDGKTIRIVDRVAGVSYVLNTVAKTATSSEMAVGGRRGGVPGFIVPTTVLPNPDGDAVQRKAAAKPAIAIGVPAKLPNFTAENLGTQTVNGVLAQGVRTTSIIPVGAIGNNRELKTVNERWDSKDLGILIKSVNTDPRFGTTTYELTNIVQGAPDPSLFRVPAEYTISPPRN